ncbi:MAG: CarD family transcriptional regulator [Oscillospiraceae bacterium]|nr:CarD family transcriptional regulator [Oscillospiraceae bacterium]
MYAIGEKIIYGEQGACEISDVGHVAMQGIAKDRLFYTLRPLSGGGTIYAPVDSPVYMSPVMAAEEAKAFLAAIPAIEATVCPETKVTKADAYYKSIFSSHSREALVAMLKGLAGCCTDRRHTLNLRLERISKRARDFLESELSAALAISTQEAQQLLADAMKK